MYQFVIGITYLVLLSALITTIFAVVIKKRGPWSSFWPFFTILFLVVFATEAWIGPIGPNFKEIYWLPPLVVGLAVALLLAAATPTGPRRPGIEGEPIPNPQPGFVLSSFFWFLIVFLVVLVMFGLLG